jgi:hypothetical protein
VVFATPRTRCATRTVSAARLAVALICFAEWIRSNLGAESQARRNTREIAAAQSESLAQGSIRVTTDLVSLTPLRGEWDIWRLRGTADELAL